MLGVGENRFNSKSCGAHARAMAGHHRTLSSSTLLLVASSPFFPLLQCQGWQSQAATAGFASHLPTSALLCSALFRAMPSRSASSTAEPGAAVSASATGLAPSLLRAPTPRSPALSRPTVSCTSEPSARLPRQAPRAILLAPLRRSGRAPWAHRARLVCAMALLRATSSSRSPPPQCASRRRTRVLHARCSMNCPGSSALARFSLLWSPAAAPHWCCARMPFP
jgi:hypothetical protein